MSRDVVGTGVDWLCYGCRVTVVVGIVVVFVVVGTVVCNSRVARLSGRRRLVVVGRSRGTVAAGVTGTRSLPQWCNLIVPDSRSRSRG